MATAIDAALHSKLNDDTSGSADLTEEIYNTVRPKRPVVARKIRNTVCRI